MSQVTDIWPASVRKQKPEGFILLGTYPHRGTVGVCTRCTAYAVRYGPYFYRWMKRHAAMIHEQFNDETQAWERI